MPQKQTDQHSDIVLKLPKTISSSKGGVSLSEKWIFFSVHPCLSEDDGVFFNSTTYLTEKKSSKNSVIQLFKEVSPKEHGGNSDNSL